MKEASRESDFVSGACVDVAMQFSSDGTQLDWSATEQSVVETKPSMADVEDTAGGEIGTWGSFGGGGVPSDDEFPEEGSPEAVTLLGVARECVGEPLFDEAWEFVGEQYLARMCRKGSADLRLNTVTCKKVLDNSEKPWQIMIMVSDFYWLYNKVKIH